MAQRTDLTGGIGCPSSEQGVGVIVDGAPSVVLVHVCKDLTAQLFLDGRTAVHR
jgi:hypothetical protein